MKIRIGIFAPVLSQKKLTGIGRYTYEIIKRLPKKFQEYEFFLIGNKDITQNPKREKIDEIIEENRFFRKLSQYIWFRYLSYRLINSLNLNYIWSVIPITPLNLKNSTKKVVTLYDFTIYIAPETMKFQTWLNYKLFFKKVIVESDKIITISRGTSQKLEKFFKKKADAIVRPGIDKNLFKKLKKKKSPFKYDYILSVATLEPRKNINSLIKAFISLKKEGKLENIKLVLVGGSGWKNKSVKRIINDYNSEIIYLGYVSDEKLTYLYNGAKVFVYPSIYEGFGIPVLEARNCGCCVITTDIIELKEACGKGCIYIQPDTNSIKQALEDFFYKNKTCNYQNEHIIYWDDEILKLKKVFV